MMANGFQVKKAALARVAFFLQNDAYPNHLRFVGKHVNKTSKGNLDKLLIVVLADSDLLLPPIILPMTSVPIRSATSRSMMR